ncbi:3-hydroxyacyl-CoA dehydrogenase NAD-binding domain-containing protein [Acuticoccus sp. MNP-M23]|uniref:3-hydroxyacyl-CoA dehydrogenase NAD-binding domain-containing protein n=1 Tax=Acuticoccus sp. MNP-M23 TaxID=3072793 RepID=UPI0028166B42|nr:3-hydroxyacyl-CoA dehydrogenase NAD-binding domain-containing protein [Acuticoccus sp. MNP-M23]WMS41202.1 3-hydroxyacyl-CoA dehydrogenase NAD-binding domain-containing protein [Acuticoccus sp. MNP-M23]
MSETPVTTERVGRIGLVAIDNPPVNAASHAVRAGIASAIDALAADDGVDAIALYGVGRTFIAGADIREFGKPPQSPGLTQVCSHIEACAKPVVALIHGTTLGGGLEIALGCHARVALPGTQVGFPEVTLGLIPGAGGTQRAPRLTGIKAALDLITSGKRIDADAALTLGLIDRLGEGPPREAAIKAGEDIVSGALPHRRTGELGVAPDEAALDAKTAEIARKQPNLFAPVRCVEAVAASARLPIADGIALERTLFEACLESPQRAGLVHAFFAERAVAKIPEASATPRPVERIGVIGGGTMGSGIATAFLLAGYSVTMVERDADGLARGQATVEKNLAGAVKRGKLSEARLADINAGAFSGATTVDALAEADLIIEAAFEDMAVKQDLFSQLDKAAKKGAILATNTSYLDVDAIAAITSRPADVIGLHFFSPAHVMRLLEVVVADKTAADVVATGFAVARKLGKVAVRAGVCEGFIGNRILSHYRKAAEYLVMDGASPAEVDRALEDFGFAMGPHAVFDLAGLDIAWAARKRLAATRPAEERYAAYADKLCEAGQFGRKTGRGFYLYGEDVDGRPQNPEALAFIEAEREKAGITPRTFSAEEIVQRYLTAMIAEAARVVEDGTALRPIDVDAVLLFGYGFPRFRGGPLFLADTIGAARLVRRMEDYAQEDPFYWQVPPLLRTLAEEDRTFASLNG